MSRSTKGGEDFPSQFAFISCRERNRQFHLESNRLYLGREVKVISQLICASSSLGPSRPGERKCHEAPKAAKIFRHNSHSSGDRKGIRIRIHNYLMKVVRAPSICIIAFPF
ncbi:hypothetical protein CEXT_604781 [Caerostris extrusa]|uniref:Uncharacterized protein n=1 Tax=Caerostris extrusa TaxID=172846 RepID=A0AAV4TWR4_CAEEX|nr:hypothetical protein CEXT_604781 [Caerostris extrusa]